MALRLRDPAPVPRACRAAARGLAPLLVALALVGPAQEVAAHGLRLSVQPVTDGLRGRATYGNGAPARGEPAFLHAAADTPALAQTTTDEGGRFHFPLQAAGAYRVVIEADEGHRAEAAVTWAPPAGGAAAEGVAAAVRSEIAPLREDLARLEARVRLADFVGGLGLLVGIAGATAWWRARHPR